MLLSLLVMLMRRFYPVFVLILCATLLFFPLLLGGKALVYGDIAFYFVPQLDLARHNLLQGRLTLWNPLILSGTPAIGNPQAWPLYPSSLLLWFVSPERLVGLIGAFHCFFAALGTYLFLRSRGMHRFAALFSSISWGFGGFLVSKMQFPNMVQAASFLPWLLWSLEGMVQNIRGFCILFALTTGLFLLAAHPQMFYMAFYLAFCWILYRFRLLSKPTRNTLFFSLLGALLLGVLLSLGQMLPSVGLALESTRPQMSLAEANRFYLPIPSLPLNLIVPNWQGHPADLGGYKGKGNYWEPCCYAGILPFIFAFSALWLPKFVPKHLHQDILFWSGTAFISFWLALGKIGGLYALAFFVLPGTRTFHDPARWLYLATFSLACLAGWSLHTLLRHAPIFWKKAAPFILFFTALDVLLFSSRLNPTQDAALYTQARQQTHPSGSSTGRTYEDKNWWNVLSKNSKNSYESVRTSGSTLSLLTSGVPDLNMLSNQETAGGYEPVFLTNYAPYLSGLRDGSITPPPPNHRAVWQSPNLPGEFPLRITSPNPEMVQVSLPQFSLPGTVVLRDTAATGWEAFADGVPLSYELAEGVFKSVNVPAGTQNVVFRYNPTLFRLGLFGSLLGGGILATCLILLCPRVLWEKSLSWMRRGRLTFPTRAVSRPR